MFLFLFPKKKKCVDNDSCDFNELSRRLRREINLEMYDKLLRFSQTFGGPMDLEMNLVRHANRIRLFLIFAGTEIIN
jgi:hypothetical protein